MDHSRNPLLVAVACSLALAVGCGGTDSPGNAVCPGAIYDRPGCGSNAQPLCGVLGDPDGSVCKGAEYYCACDGTTTFTGGACGITSQPYLHAGDCEGTDARPVTEPERSVCLLYPKSSTDSEGQSWWWWRFRWQDAIPPTACAAWGPDARIIVEVDQPPAPAGTSSGLPICTTEDLSSESGPPCAIPNAWRFEEDCHASGLLFDLPSQVDFHGYYHIESSQYPTSARRLIRQDTDCGRELYASGGLATPPVGIADGGVTYDSAIPDAPMVADAAVVDTSPTF